MGGSLSGIALKDLLEAGVHFGHQTKRWNPKMKQYIFGERNGIYIIDLSKTAKLFRDAEQFASNLASDGRTILFVGTKRQAQSALAVLVTEVDGGTSTAVVRVALSRPATRRVTAQYTTLNGSARSGTDYVKQDYPNPFYGSYPFLETAWMDK